MNTDKHRLMFEDQTQQIIGCSMEVLNELGHGLLEKPYENALAHEFDLRKIVYEQQPRYEITYKDKVVGEYVPDLIVFKTIVVDTKVIEQIGDHETGQMINYLKITGLHVGLIINFKYPKLKWKRIAL